MVASVKSAAGGLRGRPRWRFGVGSSTSGAVGGGGKGAGAGDNGGVTNWLKDGDSGVGDW